MTKELIRQGDVLLRPINRLPNGLERKDNVLAYGEITGHHHRFAEGLKQVKVFHDKKTAQQFAVLDSEAVLEHEDHSDLKVPKGIYEVVIQREFDLVEGIRQVMD